MKNLAELKHLQPADLKQPTIDDLRRKHIIKKLTQFIPEEEVMSFCNEQGSGGLKIILPVPLPDKQVKGKRIVTLAAFKAGVPLLANEFALTTELLLSDKFFGNKNFILLKIYICQNGNEIFIIVNASDDTTGGDGTKVRIPLPE